MANRLRRKVWIGFGGRRLPSLNALFGFSYSIQSANGYFGDGEGQRRDSRMIHRQEPATKDTHSAKDIIDVEYPIRIEHRNVSQLSPPIPVPKNSRLFVIIRGHPHPLPSQPNVALRTYSLLLPPSLLIPLSFRLAGACERATAGRGSTAKISRDSVRPTSPEQGQHAQPPLFIGRKKRYMAFVGGVG